MLSNQEEIRGEKMSEAINTEIDEAPAPEFVRPGSEQDLSKRGPIPAAHEVPLDEINPVWNRLFSENRMLEYFERLRREDPVHFNETDVAGRFWSLSSPGLCSAPSWSATADDAAAPDERPPPCAARREFSAA